MPQSSSYIHIKVDRHSEDQKVVHLPPQALRQCQQLFHCDIFISYVKLFFFLGVSVFILLEGMGIEKAEVLAQILALNQ